MLPPPQEYNVFLESSGPLCTAGDQLSDLLVSPLVEPGPRAPGSSHPSIESDWVAWSDLGAIFHRIRVARVFVQFPVP